MIMKKLMTLLVCFVAGIAAMPAAVTYDVSQLNVDSLRIRGNRLAMMTQLAEISVYNSGTDDYEGYWYVLEADKTSGQLVPFSGTAVRIEAGRSATATLPVELSEGWHNLLLAADGKGEKLLADCGVMIEPLRPLDMTATLHVEMMAEEDGRNVLYGNRLQGRIDVRNNEVAPYLGAGGLSLGNGLTFRVEEVVSGLQGGVLGTPVRIASELAPETTLSHTCSADYEFKAGQRYALIVSYSAPDGRVDIGSVEFVAKDGMNTYWTADRQVKPLPETAGKLYIPAEATAVDLRGVYAVNTMFSADVSQANPNCIYYLNDLDYVAGVNATRIAVRGGQAARAIISEGHDFMCPLSFQVRHASFVLTPTYMMNNGVPTTLNQFTETVVLPFDVTMATLLDINEARDSAVQQQTYLQPTDADLLEAYQYLGDAGDSLNVGRIILSALKANVPYILALRVASRVNFIGEDVTIRAWEPAVVEGKNYNLVGTMQARAATPATYTLATLQNTFYAGLADNLIPPFKAYVEGEEVDKKQEGGLRLSGFPYINTESQGEQTTKVVVAQDAIGRQPVAAYTLSGQRIGSCSVESLRPGLYIIGGRKLVVK